MGDKPHIVFISERCQHSNALIKKLQETQLINKFQIVSIDRTPPPPFLKKVPTILANKKDKIEGKSAFEWVDRQTNVSNELEPVSTGYGKGGFDSMSESYSFIEQSGQHLQSFLQNSYSFINDRGDNVKEDVHGPGGMGGGGGGIAGLDNGQARMTGTADKDSRLERLKQERDNDNYIPRPVHRV